MPRYKSMKTLRRRNPSIYDVLEKINIFYTRHKIEKQPIGKGISIFLASDFAIDGIHYAFSIKIEKGELKHSFMKKPKNKQSYRSSSISTLRKLLTEGE